MEAAAGPAPKRAKSLPPPLLSNPLQTSDVNAKRKPITLPKQDVRPPMDFRGVGGKREAVEFKQSTMSDIIENHYIREWLPKKIESSPSYMNFLESIHPRIASYNPDQLEKAYDALANTHPRLIVDMAKKRNRLYGISNYPTTSRPMKFIEQKFLSQAMLRMREDVEKKPFHIHGESGAVGDKQGNIREFTHEPGEAVTLTTKRDDKYTIHSHPPYGKPFDFSPSEPDHKVGTETYLIFNGKMNEYLTNGKDVLLIQPDSMELVKLHPNKKWEKKLGTFPVAFTVPHPQQPPRPFLNHEAPATFGNDYQPPAGWIPPPDYPKDEAVAQNDGPSTSRKRPASPNPPEHSQPAKSARPSEPSHT
jgi:hypothetical protein